MARSVVAMNILELEPPHGFLIAQEKQTAIAKSEPLDTETDYVIVCNGEAFGVVTLEEPAQIKTKEFDADEWLNQHRVTPRERRQWWPDDDTFYVYRFKEWKPYEGVKLYEDGEVIDEPKLTASQWRIVSKAKELPKQITLLNDVVSVTEKQEFIIDLSVKCKELDRVLSATYQTDVKEAASAKELIPLYSLVLVRNPRMRVSKKNIIAEGEKAEVEAEAKQEGENMPFGIVQREGEFCVINTDTEEVMGCHDTEDEAEDQLAALRIQVETEEGEGAKQFDESAWDGSAGQWDTAEAFCSDSLIDVNLSGEEKVKGLCKLPFRSPGKTNPNLGALRNIAARFNQIEKPADVPQEKWNSERKAAANKLISWWPEAFDQPAPEVIFRAAGGERPEKAKKVGFMERLKLAAKNILDIVTLAEAEEKEVKLFVNEVGIAQKTVNGELWHFTWSTNAFEDREEEIFSTKSLENYIKEAEEKNDRGVFNLWHINKEDGNFNTDFAEIEWQGVVGRFLIEAGPYLEDEKGQAAKEFFGKHPRGHSVYAPEGWGSSPEYRYLPEQRATGTYDWIWKTRTSTLPRAAAANIWTKSDQLERGKKMALSDQQKQLAVELFGDSFVSKMIEDAEGKTAELETAGVAHKSNDDKTEQQEELQEVQLNMEELAAEVGKQFQMDLTPIAEAISTMASGLKELEERLGKLEKTKQIKDKTEAPRFVFNMQRASEAEETTVTEDDGLKNQKPNETKAKDGDSWSQIFA